MIQNLPSPKTKKKSVRKGRGYGSQRGGHTTGQGTKGQKSRSGYTKPGPSFEGGQNPLSKRLPQMKGMYGSGNRTRKRGYITAKTKSQPVQLSELENNFKSGDTVTEEKLIESGLVSNVAHKKLDLKILFDKEISKKLVIEGVSISKSAKAAIEKAGGEIK